jgi:hypothetical protein
MCRLSRDSGASTSWKPKGLSRPVAGKLLLVEKIFCLPPGKSFKFFLNYFNDLLVEKSFFFPEGKDIKFILNYFNDLPVYTTSYSSMQ